MKNKRIKYILLAFGVVALICVFTLRPVFATGFFDETVNGGNLWSKYDLNNYQLDFVKGGMLDFKSVFAGLTSALWQVCLFISNLTGYVVSQAFKLDIVTNVITYLGTNIQRLTGVSPQGFQKGFFTSSIILLVVLMGGYIIYSGLFKKQVSKSVSSLLAFLILGCFAVSFFSFSSTYLNAMNDFSTDLSTMALDVGNSVTFQNGVSSGSNSVDTVRDTLFNVQIYRPWQILQFGETNIDEAREKEILQHSPKEETSKNQREAAVEKDYNDNDNWYLSLDSVGYKLGNVILLLISNIIISLFVILLSGMMITSQIMFLLLAMLLPFSLIIGLIPSQQQVATKAIVKLFYTILNRAFISLVVALAFCVSSLLYGLTSSLPFYFVMFLQIMLFMTVYTKLSDVMGVFGLGKEATSAKGFMSGILTGSFVRQGLKKVLPKNSKSKSKGNSLNNKVNLAEVNSATGAASTKKDKKRKNSKLKDTYNAYKESKNGVTTRLNSDGTVTKNYPVYKPKNYTGGIPKRIDRDKNINQDKQQKLKQRQKRENKVVAFNTEQQNNRTSNRKYSRSEMTAKREAKQAERQAKRNNR